jgi:hypothetical protein
VCRESLGVSLCGDEVHTEKATGQLDSRINQGCHRAGHKVKLVTVTAKQAGRWFAGRFHGVLSRVSMR